MPNLPFESVRRNFPQRHRVDLVLHANKQPCPVYWHDQTPVTIGEGVDFLVATDHLVILSSPGQSEVSDAIVQVSRLEVDDPRQPVLLEQEIPPGEVSMDHNRLGAAHVDALEALSRQIEMPLHHVCFRRMNPRVRAERSV
jgi:hypothetical protein